MSVKAVNQRAWWLVLPVVVLVGFNAIVPLMTVVNYSVQETFGNNRFFFEGVKWFEEVLHSPRFHDALKRQLLFTAVILVIQIPLGMAIALAMPRRGVWASLCLVLMSMPSLYISHKGDRSLNLATWARIRLAAWSISSTVEKRPIVMRRLECAS